MRYSDLRPGDVFRFAYPHHGDVAVRAEWRKLEVGYERVDGTEWRPDLAATSPMPLERLVTDPP